MPAPISSRPPRFILWPSLCRWPARAEPDQLRYLLRIAPGALTLQPKAEDWKVNVLMAVCTFDAKGDQFRLFTQDLSGTLNQNVLRKWQTDGMPDAITVEQDPALRRIRLAVLDVPT